MLYGPVFQPLAVEVKSIAVTGAPTTVHAASRNVATKEIKTLLIQRLLQRDNRSF
jgi:hypothetical protein